MSNVVRRRTRIPVLLGILLMFSASMCAQSAGKPAPHRNLAVRNSREAAEALFERSDLAAARAAAQQVFRPAKHRISNQSSVNALLEALFVDMEAASLQADTHAVLDAALRLCEVAGETDDPRVSVASSRILDLSGNTLEFRAVVPRIKTMLASGSHWSNQLRAALLTAAADGAPGLSTFELARQSGLITDWKIAGPIGEFPNVAFEQTWDPERDGLTREKYGGRYVETFQFATGEVTLPDYMAGSGIYYAAAQVKLSSSGTWLLRVESPGTIETWIDGMPMFTKDDRFRTSSETLGVTTNLRAGTHHVLVKFLPSAVPFRVAVVPSTAFSTRSRPPSLLSDIESAYVAAAKSYWSGDYRAANSQLMQLRATHESAPVDLLLAQSRLHSGENNPDYTELLESTLRLAPGAYAAKQELASIHLRKGEFKDALETAKAITAAQPRFEPAVRVVATAASRVAQNDIAGRAFATASELHPSCTELKDAAAFFESISDLEQANAYESRLRNCAPGSLAWPEALARRGLHAESAVALQQTVAASPLNRNAREMLVRELTLAGKSGDATAAIDELVSIAPNSNEFRAMAATLHAGGEVLDSISADNSLSARDQFYAPYRRDGIEVVSQTAARKFFGGPLAILLNDCITEVKPNGEASVYVHRISRVLDRYGINKYGEVTVPKDASLLELRTIKADGSIVEPEFNQHKSTISMPALAPGDAIDLEYIVEASVASDPDLFQFTFGSFSAPMAFSRFTVLTPANSSTRFELSGILPPVRVTTSGNTVVRTWEQNDIAQFDSENSMPRSGVLPSITLLSPESRGWAGVRDFYRDAFIDAVQESSRVQNLARELAGSTSEQRLRSAYNFVVSRVKRADTDYESGDIATADSTLQSYGGSRTALLLALAKVMGMKGRVVMARDVSLRPPEIPTPHAYTHPLLVFESPEQGDIVLDPETTGMIFGGVSATLDTRDALVVPIYDPDAGPQITALPKPTATERSTATGDVEFDDQGDLTAHIEIRMGAARGAQMRATLRTINPQDRKRFFEQLASRIFSGVTDSNGEVQNETNTNSQLVLVVNCQAARFLDLSKNTAEVDQLVPALGLKRMYATDGSRKWPLVVDTPLFESSTFRISLPDGAHFAPLFNDVKEHNEFGSYSVTFRMVSPSTVEVRREFDIPVQIIRQEQFSSFARFARTVDEAERPHLIVQRSGEQARSRGAQD